MQQTAENAWRLKVKSLYLSRLLLPSVFKFLLSQGTKHVALISRPLFSKMECFVLWFPRTHRSGKPFPAPVCTQNPPFAHKPPPVVHNNSQFHKCTKMHSCSHNNKTFFWSLLCLSSGIHFISLFRFGVCSLLISHHAVCILSVFQTQAHASSMTGSFFWIVEIPPLPGPLRAVYPRFQG